ncbi:hypothetical protein OS127_03040 [Corynebacterium sp. P6129]|uniref:hypothetical protein n=1 Tax=Corynebacterium antarcticum TaxID=2800405 RepID=UPI002260B566|nr:hypothetical protein [Corynebacterium antarcticum]MCX7491504.1 hypothetical protein [Corynebacterium antarcticum]
MDTNLITSAITVIPSVFAIWFAREQLRYERQKDNAHDLDIEYEETLCLIKDGEYYQQMEVGIVNNGIIPIHNLSCAITFNYPSGGWASEAIGDARILMPGDEIWCTSILIPAEHLNCSHLHVSWIAPPQPSLLGNSQYRAVRLPSTGGPWEIWKWYRAFNIRRRLNLPTGKWIKAKPKNIFFTDKHLPEWPDKTVDPTYFWDD